MNAAPGEHGEEALDGEADYVGTGTLDRLDEADGVLLGGVGAGFVEDMDAAQVVFDLGGAQGAETDVRDLDEGGEGVGGAVFDPYAGEHLVGAAGERGEHGAGVIEIGGFAEGTAVEGDEGIGG